MHPTKLPSLKPPQSAMPTQFHPWSLFGSHVSQCNMLSNTCFIKKSIVSTFTDFKDCLLDGIRHMISERLSITLHIVGRSHCSCVRDGVGEGELFPE
ncbi:hypothetical protein VNO80_30543 [Phaseolus coccineus]|uniref:Uncharacterized protein n=1 Tax=Phaseolus coccineus TaxID=3886 RepID=A0AAN9LDE1_PHACN